MLRYLRRLSARDYALDRGMIPLGSCTMKLNATTEMEPISLPGFADLHPFAPAEDAAGLPRADRRSSRAGWPRSPATTGSRSSRTPARRASSPGCWRSAATTAANGDEARDVCLIPSSAHGTNAASAVMAGMRVVVVKAADDGARRPRRPARPVRGARRRPRRDHGHLPVDARRLRGRHHRAVRDRARARRPGLRRRREPQRAARATPSPASSAATSRTSTCTRRSASRTAAAVPASARSAVRAHLAPYLPVAPDAPGRRRGARASARSAPRRTARPGSCRSRGPTSRMMGGRGAHRRRRPSRCCRPTTSPQRLGEHFPVLYTRPRRPGRPRVHPRPARAHQGDRRHRRRRRQAADRLRLPRADDELPGRRHADGRADRVRGPRRDRPVLRRDDRDPRRDRPGRGGGVDARGRRRCAAPRTPRAALAGEWDRAYSP